MSKRKPINMRTKLAAALLTMVRPECRGLDGRWIYVHLIPPAEAKTMTADEIIARFDFDHTVYKVWDGPDLPWNLVPRLRADHREKTKRDIKEIAKVRRGLKKRSGPAKPKKKIPSRPFPSKQARKAWKEQRGLV